MEKIKNEEKFSNTFLFRLNVGDVKMMPFISTITNIMSILGHKSFYRKIEDQFHVI